MDESWCKLDDVFNLVKKKLKISEIYDLDIHKIWKDVTGDTISQVSMPIFIEDGVLTVNIRDAIWANELSLLKNEIIKRLNESFGKELIKDIRFKVGIIKIRENQEKNHNIVSSLEKITLSSDDLNLIENAIATIEDEELRERTRNLFINLLKRKYLCENKVVK